MIGGETLWDTLVVTSTLPSLNSHFHHIFLSAKHSPAHLAPFSSKLLLSAILSDNSHPTSVRSTCAQIWLRAHGFASPIPITLPAYVDTVVDFGLLSYLAKELRALPDVVCGAVLAKLLVVMGTSTKYLDLYPHVMEIELLRCKLGVSRGDSLENMWQHLTVNHHNLSLETTDRLVQLANQISHLTHYTGVGTVISSTEGVCGVAGFTSQHTAGTHETDDTVLETLHTESKSGCCTFQTVQNLSSKFRCLTGAEEGAVLFCNSLVIGAINQGHSATLETLYSIAVFILSEQMLCGLYAAPHIQYLRDLVSSIPAEIVRPITHSPVYKTYNFNPALGTWSELYQQVQHNLSHSAASWTVLLTTRELEEEHVPQVLDLLRILDQREVALLYSRTVSDSHLNKYTAASARALLSGITQHLALQNTKFLCGVCKALYKDTTLATPWTCSYTSPPDNTVNVTKTINQLGSKGSAKWREGLYRDLLLYCVHRPAHLVTEVLTQATRNKALVSPVAALVKDFLPFLFNPSSELYWTSVATLKGELALLKTLKEIKQFDYFLSSLSPTLSHEFVVKHILLPGTGTGVLADITSLQLLKCYLQRVPFYSFSTFYKIVGIWARTVDRDCIVLLDDEGIMESIIKQMICAASERERKLFLKVVDVSKDWEVALRLSELYTSEKITLPKIWNNHDVSQCLGSRQFDFNNTTCMEESVTYILLKIAMLAPSLVDHVDFTDCNMTPKDMCVEVYGAFSRLNPRSKREWDNITNFLHSLLSGEVITIETNVTIETNIETNNNHDPISVAIQTCSDVMRHVDMNPTNYLFSDFITFVCLSIISGNEGAIKWFGKATEVAESANRTFVLTAILVHLNPTYQYLETLVMSIAKHISDHEDIDKAMSLLPTKLQSALYQKLRNTDKTNPTS